MAAAATSASAPVDEITLAKARDKAHEARKALAKGIDPTIERQKAKLKIPTFREAAKLVHEEHKAAWKNGKHQDGAVKVMHHPVVSQFEFSR